MKSIRRQIVLAWLLIAGIVPTACGETVDYLKDIKPLLSAKCYSCHGAIRQESGLRLETRSLMLKGGDSGAAIKPGDSEGSALIERVAADPDSRMPPEGEGAALKPDEIRKLRLWIESGASAPEEETPAGPLDHWAFRPIMRPPIPARVSGASFAEHPVDAFLEQQRVKRGLRVQPEADRQLLIRRLYLDLIGLPPTREQLNDSRPWGQIVDELLESPHHGERWGRHWMDVWRYSDWYGLGAQLRNSQKHIWRWRDWIVESLNQDKGYDRMIQEMLAGDELAPTDPEVLRATGFLARNYYLFNRTTWLDSTIEHTGKAFLGLTLNCAKCHDHKYDPITHVDYYRFRAIFEPHQVRLDPVPGVIDLEKDGLPRVFDDHTELATYLHLRGDPKQPDKETEITPGTPALFDSFAVPIEPVELPAEAFAPALLPHVAKDRLAAAEQQVEVALKQLKAAQKKLAEAETKPSPVKTEPKTLQGTSFLVESDFEKLDESTWKLTGAGWKFDDGKLLQTQSTRDQQFVTLSLPHPDDFELMCRYTHTGGATYKSITFRFDQSSDAKFSNYVYTSAHAPGPKIQVAYTRGGTSSYPPEGRKSFPIKVGEVYELRFAVRGTLVNVWLNDKFQLAYNLPTRGKERGLSFSAFDGTAAFDSIRIRSLPVDIELTSASNKPAANPADPAQAVRIAEAALAVARARIDELNTITAADRARLKDGLPQEQLQPLLMAAATAQLQARVASAEQELLSAGADQAKSNAASKKLDAARNALAEIKTPTYESIRASRKALETPAHKETDYAPIYSSTSTGRRTALAKWITSRQNPLTARVAVNHVWMRHFGEPLVESVFDFGLRSKQPAHAQLLDYLASEFMDSGWSFRHLHRLIVTSQAYQLSTSGAGVDEATHKADPNNQYLWRMNSRRMEAQVVRDCLLDLAGVLDRQLGGPAINPAQGGTRRSLYFQHSRDQQDKFLDMFDDADHLQCYRRSESIVPQQALAMSNSKLSLEMAVKIAQRIQTGMAGEVRPDSRESFVDVAFLQLMGRPAEAAETAACLEFCKEVESLHPDLAANEREQRIRERLIHALINHNDFISIR